MTIIIATPPSAVITPRRATDMLERDDGLHQFGIGAEARGQFADTRALVKRLIEGEQMAKQVAAQIGNGGFAEQGDAVVTRSRRDGQHDRDAKQGGETRIDRGDVGVHKAAIDHDPHRERQRQGSGRGQCQEGEPAKQQSAVRA